MNETLPNLQNRVIFVISKTHYFTYVRSYTEIYIMFEGFYPIVPKKP